jgi:hypothetical protein
VKGKYFQPITSNAPKITTTTDIDVASFKIGSFHGFGFGYISKSTLYYIFVCGDSRPNQTLHLLQDIIRLRSQHFEMLIATDEKFVSSLLVLLDFRTFASATKYLPSCQDDLVLQLAQSI